MKVEIPFFDLINKFLIGAVFVICLYWIAPLIFNLYFPKYLPKELVIVLYTMSLYAVGLVINRIGSICVEGFLKFIKVLKFCSYETYLKAVKEYPNLNFLSREYNNSRTFFTLFFILLFIVGFFSAEFFMFLFLSVLFFVSMMKYYNKIKQILEVFKE